MSGPARRSTKGSVHHAARPHGFPFAPRLPGQARSRTKPILCLPKAPLLYFRGFCFSPEACLREFLALSFKQRTKLGHCFAGIWCNERPAPAHNFCIIGGGGRNLCGMFKDNKTKQNKTLSAPKCVPILGAEVAKMLLLRPSVPLLLLYGSVSVTSTGQSSDPDFGGALGTRCHLRRGPAACTNSAHCFRTFQLTLN